MPKAKIVYTGAGGGGDLFEGKKFYLLQRIPSRDKWKDLVTANGGEVVVAEAQADIIIADHARNHQPVGSISWTFIDQSVAKGELQDIDNHRAGPVATAIRDVGSKQPTKQGRTPFTAEDDRILTEWCTKAERQGVSVKGNILYQQLEEKNNRHTFQSWRDRWIKHLDRLPRPSLNDEENNREDEVEEVVGPRSVKRKEAPQNIPSRSKNTLNSAAPNAKSRAPAQRESSQRRSAPRSSIQAEAKPREPLRTGSTQRPLAKAEPAHRGSSQRGSVQQLEQVPNSSPAVSSPTRVISNSNIFTEKETNKLVKFHDDILTVADDRIIDFWITWESKNDEHTAQEWCNHFKEYVVPKMKLKGKFKDMPPPAAKAPVTESAPKASSSRIIKQETIEVKDSQEHSSGRTLGSDREEKLIDPSILDEAVFIEDVSTLAREYGVDVDFNPIISGRSISLFNLWQLAESDDFGGFDRVNEHNLWAKIASRLGLDPKRHPTAPEELQICFSELLADFEDLLHEAPGPADDDEIHESALLEAQLRETTNRETVPEELEVEDDVDQEEEPEHDDDLNSPQVLSLQKPHDSDSKKRGSNGSGSSPYTKRQRVDKGKGKEREIPSTPEDAVNNRQLFHATHQQSPLKNSSFAQHSEISKEDSSDEEGLFVTANKKGAEKRPLPKVRNLEPETQDFHFPELERQAGNESPELSSSPPPLLNVKSQTQLSTATTHGSANSTNMEDSSTQSQTESQKQIQLQEFIDDLVEKGYPQEIVIQALEATTLEAGPNVEKVAEKLVVDEHIPNNIRGVWIQWDDEALDDPVESKEYRHILLKHGAQRLKARRKYLAEQALWKHEHGDEAQE